MDLTEEERRFILIGLWLYKNSVIESFDKNREASGEDALGHELEAVERIESAVRKVGGDVKGDMYGAPFH